MNPACVCDGDASSSACNAYITVANVVVAEAGAEAVVIVAEIDSEVVGVTTEGVAVRVKEDAEIAEVVLVIEDVEIKEHAEVVEEAVCVEDVTDDIILVLVECVVDGMLVEDAGVVLIAVVELVAGSESAE